MSVQTDQPNSKASDCPSPDEAVRWRAVVTRDASANTFVYGVRTTHIYCRPSCPARLARRANIVFFDSPAQAEAAGFRSCKRCRPQLDRIENPQIQLVQVACDSIAKAVSLGRKVMLKELATDAGLTPSHFHRVFKKIIGVTPGQYAKDLRSCNTQEMRYESSNESIAVPAHFDEDAFWDEIIDWNELEATVEDG